MADGYDIFGDTRGYQFGTPKPTEQDPTDETHRGYHPEGEDGVKVTPFVNALAPSRFMQDMVDSRVTRRRSHRLLKKSLTRRGWRRLNT